MARLKRVEAAGTGFVERLRDAGLGRVADRVEAAGEGSLLGFSLFHRLGVEFIDHARHYRCWVDAVGRVDEARCVSRDACLYRWDNGYSGRLPALSVGHEGE